MDSWFLSIGVALRHILELEPRALGLEDRNNAQAIHDEAEPIKSTVTTSATLRRRCRSSQEQTKTNRNSVTGNRECLLDLSGPKLMSGLTHTLLFSKVVACINWTGYPLYVSILYKLLVFSLVTYRFTTGFIYKFMNLHIVSENFKNPIFLFIGFLAILTTVLQLLVNIRIQLFDLCPIFKILDSEKLCFVKRDVLERIGNRSVGAKFIVSIYHALLMCMLTCKNLDDFIDQFHFGTFVLDVFTIIVINYNLLGVGQLDFYIRSSFGHWLLALRDHMEHQFMYCHKLHSLGGQAKTISQLGPPIRLITLDEIQRCLNNMDDHLEVMREVHTVALVLLSLNSFLGNGAIFLLTFHLFADQGDYYHGFLFLLISFNYIFFIFTCYWGDSWVKYALSSLVQSIEDEYFLQNEIKTGNDTEPGNVGETQKLISVGLEPSASSTTATIDKDGIQEVSTETSLDVVVLKKKHVLFYREFQHQFDHHLATQWSNLTFKSHLHILRAFVTLIAAQIIFDHEH